MGTEEPSESVEEQERQQRIDRLAEIFAVDGKPLKDDELELRLAELSAAASEEYELALSGSRFPATIKELRELRLRLLYEHLPEGCPTDDQIGELFQMTRTQVGTLIAGTRARFGPTVEKRIKHEARAALTQATKVSKDKVRIFAPDSLARFLGDLIAQSHAPPLEKLKDASQTYHLGRATIIELCRRLGVEPRKTVTAIGWPKD